MPYSDNLYSMVDDDSDIEPINDPSSQQEENNGLDLASASQNQNPSLNTTTLTSSSTYPLHAYDDALGSSEYVDDAAEEEDPHLFSPTDGYFGTTASNTPSGTGTDAPVSSNVPYVPNVLVEDPSSRGNKAKEVEQERLRNERGLTSSDHGYTTASAAAVGYLPHTILPSQDCSSTSTPYAMQLAQQSIPGPEGSDSRGAAYHTQQHRTPSNPIAPSAMMPISSSSASYTPYGTRRPAHHHHVQHLLFEAPPAYTPSPVSPTYSQQSGSTTFGGYRTFPYTTNTNTTDTTPSSMGRPEETQALLPRQPESMVGGLGPTGEDKREPRWKSRVRRWCPPLLVFLLLMVIVGFPIKLRIGNSDHPKTPVDKPDSKQPDKPNMSYPDIDGDFNWGTSSICKDAKVGRPTQTFDISFDGTKPLNFWERTVDDGHHNWRDTHVHGAVIFRRAGPETPSSAVTIEVAVNDDRLNIDTSWDADTQRIVVQIPHFHDWDKKRDWPCINIKTTVWVPPSGSLSSIDINTVHLDIKLLDNLSLSVSQQTTLTSTVGTIIAASTGTTSRDDKIIDHGSPDSFDFRCPIIDVKTTSAHIKGSWPLHNYLGLQSTSGDIKVCVDPATASDSSSYSLEGVDTVSKPATLFVKSTSGHVDLREPIHAAEHAFQIAQSFASPAESADRQRAELKAEALLPPRDYRVSVQTTSGDVMAAVAFSSSAAFRSTSGTVSLDLLPVLDVALAEGGEAEGRKVELVTGTTSGDMDVRVLEALWVGSYGKGIVAGKAGQNSGSGSGKYVALGTSITALAKDGSAPNPAPLRCLHGAHSTVSGDVRLRYPGSWEGDIALSSKSGLLTVGGEGVRLIKAGSEWPGVNKSLLARKGEEGKGGRIRVQTLSGDIDVWIGEKGRE